MPEQQMDNLERELVELGGRLSVPPAPDLVYGVKQRIAAQPAGVGKRAGQPKRPQRQWWRQSKLVQAVTAALLVFAVLLAASPQVRAAIADVLRFAGIEIHSESAPVQPRSGQLPRLPGERVVSLDQARDAAHFDIRVPATLGPPDEVRIADGEPPRVVSLVYRGGPGRPAADQTSGIAIRVDEFAGHLSPVYEKYLATGLERLNIDGTPAIWLPHPHPLLYVDRSGNVRQEAARMAAQTLIWQVGATTIRMEGDFTKSEAMAIARSTIP